MARIPSPIRPTLAAALLIACAGGGTPVAATQAPESMRVHRLAMLGKLWNAVRYLHPWVAYRRIDWDAALVPAVPAVSSASGSAGYAAGVARLLEALDDPLTRVLPQAEATTTPQPQPSWRWEGDRVLVVEMTDYGQLAAGPAVARMREVAARVDSARSVVFDLRRLVDHPSSSIARVLAAGGVSARLAGDTIVAPGARSRMHSGYRTETGAGASFYYSAWQLTDGDRIAPGPGAEWRPVAFIVDGGSELPAIALALRAAGRAAIIAHGAAPLPGSTTTLDMGEGVVVAMRVSETVDAGGGAVAADTVLSSAAPTESLIAAAVERVRSGRFAAVRTPLPETAPRPAARYPELSSPALPYRLLAAYRIWGVFAYFNPYQHLVEGDWDEVLEQFIPIFEVADDSLKYAQAIGAMLVRTGDSHVGLRSAALEAWRGVPLPLRIRWVEERPVVAGMLDEAVAANVQAGDEIVAVDGVAADTLIERLARYQPASTPQALMRYVLLRLGSGPDGSEAVVSLRSPDGATRDARLIRKATNLGAVFTSGRTGPVYRILPGNIGYADLERLTVPMVDSMFRAFEGTRGIIFDMRGYPQGTAWSIAPHLTERANVPAARFRRPVVTEPRGFSAEIGGGMEYVFTQYLPPPIPPVYRGPTVMLIDERAISQAEHTGLFLKAANGTVLIGSPTVGANGDVTQFVLPGGIVVSFTGHDVRHPDGSQLQRVGLRPDIRVVPTRAGLRAGRDEVLERAIRYLTEGR